MTSGQEPLGAPSQLKVLQFVQSFARAAWGRRPERPREIRGFFMAVFRLVCRTALVLGSVSAFAFGEGPVAGQVLTGQNQARQNQAVQPQKKSSKHHPGEPVRIKTSIGVVSPGAAKSNAGANQGTAGAAIQPDPVPAAPLPPPTLAQMPAVPPKVDYQGGQLTIIAENSTLGDILRAVKQKSGAAIELPSSAPERVVIHLGPAPIHDVLVSLLDGSSFNYVMVGSSSDPNAVTRVVLSPKPAGGGEVASAGPVPPAPMAGVPQPFPHTRPNENPPPEAAEADTDTADDSDDQAAQTPDQPQQTDEAAQDQNPQPGAPGIIKTPQQMLEELQRQQQQQQLLQQQQQQGVSGIPPAPQNPQQ